jgi:nitroreductase
MEILDAIRKRRSINFFETRKEIPQSILDELFKTANLSPSSFNLQPWKVVVVKDIEKKKILRQCAFNQPKVEEASIVLIMVADPAALEENLERILDSWEQLGYMKADMRETYKGMTNQLYGNPDSLKRRFFAIKNTALFAMNLMLSAVGLGLETHPMDGFDEAAVKQAFNIPDDKMIPMLIAVGYLRDGIQLLPRAYRRDIQEFIRYDSY